MNKERHDFDILQQFYDVRNSVHWGGVSPLQGIRNSDKYSFEVLPRSCPNF